MESFNIPASKPRAIVHPVLDLLCVGALSIIGITFAFFNGEAFKGKTTFGQLLMAATVINGAHFMASYRLLYFSRAQAKKYVNASVYLPLGLSLYVIWGLYMASGTNSSRFPIDALLSVTAFYLAIHYTGQAWGMMSSFAFIEQIKIAPDERKIFRLALKLLVVWQVVWALTLIDGFRPYRDTILYYLVPFSHVLLFIALLLGIYAFARMGRRIGRLPPLKIALPFFALFFWYALLYRYPKALVCVQLSHAVQYLLFPARVEMNRQSGLQKESSLNPITNLLAYFASMLFLGGVVFVLVPQLLGPSLTPAVTALIAAINIHHFYIDGYVWKISNPDVKRDLFGHLTPQTDAGRLGSPV